MFGADFWTANHKTKLFPATAGAQIVIILGHCVKPSVFCYQNFLLICHLEFPRNTRKVAGDISVDSQGPNMQRDSARFTLD